MQLFQKMLVNRHNHFLVDFRTLTLIMIPDNVVSEYWYSCGGVSFQYMFLRLISDQTIFSQLTTGTYTAGFPSSTCSSVLPLHIVHTFWIIGLVVRLLVQSSSFRNRSSIFRFVGCRRLSSLFSVPTKAVRYSTVTLERSCAGDVSLSS